MNSTRPHHPRNSASNLILSLLIVGILLILPLAATQRLGLDLRWVAGYVVVINALTWWFYAIDKKRAQEGAWRISEAQLHLCELLGGWPAAWIAQRYLRHKSSKGSYQFIFWLIVLAWQFAAVDSFQDWRLSRAALQRFEQSSRRK